MSEHKQRNEGKGLPEEKRTDQLPSLPPLSSLQPLGPADHQHQQQQQQQHHTTVFLDDLAPASFSSYGFRSFPSHSTPDTLGHAPATFLSFNDEALYRSIQTDQSHGSLGGEDMRSVDTSSYDSDPLSHFSMGDMHSSLPMLPPSSDAVLKPSIHQNRFGHPSQLDPKFSSAHHFEHPLLSEVGTTSSGLSGLPPNAPGGYLEPGYHFFSTASPKVIIDTIVSVLQAAEIDCTVKHEKFRISARHYSSGSHRLPFSVRVWATEGYDHRYAVEFQRRQGDVIVFNEIYRSTKRALEGVSGLVERSETTGKKHQTQPAVTDPLPPLVDSSEALNNTRDTLKALMQMATSKFSDVKSQAMSAICDMTHNCSAAHTTMMLSEGAVRTCSDELKSSVEDIHRVAVTAIANLSYRREDVGSAVLAADGLGSLVKLTASETPQVVRETARALANLATAVGNKMDNDDLRGALRSLMCSEDPRARAHSQELRKTLRIEAV